MPSFSSQFRVIVDPVAAEDANKVRARVARSHPGRQSPLFHNSATFMRQGTPSGRKIREGLALAAATLEDPVLMKARIARLQHDILALERETEKALRASANVGDGGHHAGLQRCLHDPSASGATGSGVTLRSIPIEDLRTALNLAAYVPDDPAGNAVRLHALTQLLLTSVDAWAETQIEWVRSFAERIVGVRLPSERELLPLPAAAGAAVPSSTSPAKARKPSTVAAVAAAAVAADAAHQHDESSVGGVLFLSRLLGCSAAPPLVTALLKGVVDTQTSVADKEQEIKQRVLGQSRAPSPSPSTSASGAAAGSPARSLTRRRLAAYEQQQQIQLFYQLQEQLARAGVPGFAADRRVHALASDDDDMVDKASQTDQALVRVLLRKYRGSDGDDSTDAEDAACGKQAQKRVPIRTANARTALRGASPASSPVAERSAFAVNVSTRVQLEEANMRIAELQRQLLFYKSLESLIAEADVIGAVTDLNFKCETLANLGLDAQSLVRNYEAAVAAAAATLVPNPSSASASLAGAPSETDFGAPSPTRDAVASGVAASVRGGGGGGRGAGNAAGGGAAAGARAASPASGAASASNTSGQPQGGAAAAGSNASTAATAASPSKKSGGGGGKGGDAAGGALAVPLAVHEASLEENRRLRGLLTVQQAVLAAVVNELDVADAFRDWVAWRRAVQAGGDAVRRAVESLRVPVCADDALAAELAEELESGASSASDGGESRSSAPRSPSQRTSPGTSARAGAAAVDDALESTLTRGETDELAKSRNGAKPKPSQPQQQQQQQQPARRASKQQGEGRHEPFGPTDLAYRRAVRENMALHRTLDKVLHRLTLLESRKG